MNATPDETDETDETGERLFETPLPEPRPDTEARTQALLEALEERVLVLDGATGTGLQAAELSAEDFGGAELEGCNENLCATRPDVVDRLHESYLAAGADVVETNTFGGTPLVLAEYGLADRAFELNRLAAELARAACARHDRPGRPRFVCGSIGPTTKAISVTGGVGFEELIEHFRVQALGLMAGGADYLLLETCQDTRNVKAGLLGLERAFEAAGWRLPVAVSATIETTGTMLAGQDAEALAVSLLHADLLYLGLNCATGPELMTEHVRTLAELSRMRTACVPNAGLPDEEGVYHQGPSHFTDVLGRFLDNGWLSLVGGCCGTTPAHTEALAKLAEGRRPQQPARHQRSLISGIEAVELTADNRPLLVGERTNVLGSRKFRRLVQAEEWEPAAEVGRAQVRGGGQVLDVCMQDPDRDEIADIEGLLERLVRMVKAPLMIDSTDAEVMERALRWCQGKAVLNSINLEDGKTRFDQVVPLAQRFGAALVVGAIDEQGMAVTVERKLDVARRSYELLVEEMGFPPEDIWWDPLVFPCATGDEAYIGSAARTIDGVEALGAEFPLTRTILGISNVSFGLPTAGREVLNSVFLYHATRAGLDAAIVNTERLARYAEIPAEERELAESLIYLEPGDEEASQAAIERFAEHFRGRSSAVAGPPRDELPLDERIARSVVEGSKEGLEADLDLALVDERWPEPLDIINGPLMTGMAEVGRLFNANELIVAEVLQSAEVMKAAVSHLEPHMERAEGSRRGKVVLATVKGDVHDIGKNLVDIVLSNNGFEVVNLGIRVPSEQLIQAVREHRPDVLGLSGLLVKSAQQMVLSAGDLAAVGVEVPMLVGGAALSRRFTHRKIAPAYGSLCTYARDAMHGLELVEGLTDPERRPELEARIAEMTEEDAVETAPPERAEGVSGTRRSASVRTDVDRPEPPDLERHVETLDLDEVWAELNPQMLYGKHLGLKGSVYRLAERGDPKLAKLERVVEELEEVARGGSMNAKAVWRFFPARGVGNRIELFAPSGEPLAVREPVAAAVGEGAPAEGGGGAAAGAGRAVEAEAAVPAGGRDAGQPSGERGEPLGGWELPRQRGRDGLCLADYVGEEDHLALFVTTAGTGVRSRAEAWKKAGEYLKSHAWAALALETAEAAAELLHRRLRAAWGIPDPDDTTLRDRLAARYRGKRYSFGYPACPDLEGQRLLFELLRPEEIGVELTEGDMMTPEASVSAIVLHHPDARYFGT